VLAENVIRAGRVLWQCLSTCLGYVARLNGAIDQRVVVPLVKRLLSDPVLGGVAQDTLDDMGRALVGAMTRSGHWPVQGR